VSPSDITLTHTVGLGQVFSTNGSLTGSARGRASSRQSISSNYPNGDLGHSPRTVSHASAKTVSPPPNHVVFPSPGQRERFRIALANNTSRVNSPAKSHDSELLHPTVGSEAPDSSLLPPATFPPRERFVSHVYCRMCRRDPCRQPAATMCGHIFCHQCISSEVVKTSQCPVCEAPTLLYSIFRLHIA